MSWLITGSQKVNWTPALISTAVWLDASDSNTLYDATSGGSLVAADGTIARWEDKSGNGRHFTQSTSDLRPTRKTAIQNGKDVVRFDGADYLLSPANTSAWGNDLLFFTNCKTTTSDNLFSLFGNATRSNAVYLAQDGSATAQAVNGSTVNGTLGTWTTRGGYWNSVAKNESFIAMLIFSASGWSSPSSDNLSIPYQSFLLPMDYNEIIITSSSLAVSVRQRVEGYLAHKWGTTAGLPADHPYKVNVPTP
jgi:hypothetical protein